ncbi:MAG: ankyrin repeat domain-containing protein [Elusimicrobia bacterium]|nr:ankyrin repeat domain-containing protein [Elusimicrobiota bacterium]
MERELAKGVSIEQPHQSNHYTPLMIAAMAGHTAAVKYLLDRGANINAQHAGGGGTALHSAVISRNPEVVRLLVMRGADAMIQNANGATALDNARDWKSETIPMPPSIITILEKASATGMATAVSSAVRPLDSAFVKSSLQPTFSAGESLDDYAVVVGIENYPDLPAATYAERDSAAVKSFIRALGVPERNIVLLTGGRATKTGMEKTIEAWLPNNVSEKSRVYVYYSGHGAPDTKTGDAYLVPSDGDPQYLAQTGYPLKRLYAKLGELKARSVLVALDSCFSGAGGRSVLAKGTRPLVGKVDLSVQAQGKVSVIAASAGDQISGANDEAGYGLFTYNLLQGLNGAAKDAQGRVTLQSLYGYLKPRVQDDARRGNREQTPQLQAVGEDFVLRAK